MPGVTDIHTHAFPDRLADRAIAALEAEAPCKACLDGRVSSLLASMDRAGVSNSVVASIATRPAQFDPILAWSLEIASDRIIPFASVHPDDPEAVERVGRIAEAGLRGIKLHPYYQRFVVDEERMLPIYRAIADAGLVFLCHAGFDIAFPRDRIADPVRVRRVLDRVPDLRLIAAHFGAWEDWDQVVEHFLGRPIFLDLSYSFGFIDPVLAQRILLEHPADRLLFGTDSPWGEQAETLRALRGRGLPDDRMQAILCDNAARLLGLE